MLIVFHFIKSSLSSSLIYGFEKNTKFDNSIAESVINRKYIFIEIFEVKIESLTMPKSSVTYLHVTIHEYFRIMDFNDTSFLNSYIDRLEFFNAVPSSSNFNRRWPQCNIFDNVNLIPYTNLELEPKGWRKTLSISDFVHYTTNLGNMEKWENVIVKSIKE